jgi:hypothetical protein
MKAMLYLGFWVLVIIGSLILIATVRITQLWEAVLAWFENEEEKGQKENDEGKGGKG